MAETGQLTAAGRGLRAKQKALQPVLRVTGLLLCLLALLMLVPAGVDRAADNADWQIFLVSALITGATGLLLAISARTEGAIRLNIREAFVLTSLLWFVLSGFSALPFLGLGLDYSDAFFEAVSGLTTTGATVIVGLDALPPGVLMWRALLQWVGGVGVIVMAMVVLPFLKVGGMQLFRAEISDASEKILPRAFDFATWIAVVYGAITLACALSYAAAGMSIFDAVSHAMSTVSTGGFSTRDASFAAFNDRPAIAWVGIVFMVAGAVPFVLMIKAARGRPVSLFSDPQVRALFTLLAFACFGTALWLTLTTGTEFTQALRHASFNIVSIVTTTGFASLDYTLWGPTAVGLFLALTFVGGCTGSTSGGVKIYRYVILGQIIRRQLRQLANPSRIEPALYGGRRIPDDVPTSVLAFLALYMATIVVVMLILTALGLDLVTAGSSAAAAVSNVGPGLGTIVGPAGTFAPLPDSAKTVLAVAMVLGRLELFTVLVLFDPDFWRW